MITYVHGDIEKLQLKLNEPFSVSACMYVMIQNLKLHIKRSKNRFQTEYSTGKREKKLHNVQFLWEINRFPPKISGAPCLGPKR